MKENEHVYNKLVRDKIPEIIEKNGDIPVTRTLDDKEYFIELEQKLLEEFHEAVARDTGKDKIEEYADMLEVISALAEIQGVTLDEIISIMDKKRKERGAFSKRIFLEKTINKKSRW